MADIHNELNAIEEGRFGSDIREPIRSALSTLSTTTYEGVDISTELATINTDPKGAHVKDAIHDALQKLSEFEPEPPEPPTGGDSVPTYDNLAFDGLDETDIDDDTFNIYKIKMSTTQLRGNRTSIIQMAELKFYTYDSEGNLVEVILENPQITASAAGNPGEGVENLLDGNTSTKYCANYSNPNVITITYTSRVSIFEFSYVTANDSSERDPISFTLAYSASGGEYQTVLTVSNATITTSRSTETDKWSLDTPIR